MVTGPGRLLVVAAAVSVGGALAQPAREPVPVEREQQLLEEIDELRARGGLHAEGLVEPLRAIGMLYQESGDHAPAVVALQEARQVLRANRGLFAATVDEAQLLSQQIRSEKALGNGQRAWNLQHDLIFIARQNLDDIRMLPIFTELIDDRAQRLDEYSTTSFLDLPAGLYVPCETKAVPTPANSAGRGAPVPVSDARNCPLGSYSTAVRRLQSAVLRHYADAIAVLIRNGDYANEELLTLEKEGLELVPFERGYVDCEAQTLQEFFESELVGSCMDTANGFGVGGWTALMRLAFYAVRSGAPAAARAKAFAELGDWYLLADHVARTPKFNPADEIGHSFYELAATELRQGAATPEAITEIFSPELPVMLPTYAPNPLESTEASRFIEVAFAITKYGRAEQIEVLDSSEKVTATVKRDLVRLIKYGSFRPRAVDGELADSAPVVVRYYLP